MTFSDRIEKPSEELWNDYFFLTKEMSKFLGEQNLDLFYELLEQREALQTMIEENKEDQFLLSASGQQLLQSIQQINQNITMKLQSIINNSRNQHNVSRAYDGLGTEFIGNRMDRQT